MCVSRTELPPSTFLIAFLASLASDLCVFVCVPCPGPSVSAYQITKPQQMLPSPACFWRNREKKHPPPVLPSIQRLITFLLSPSILFLLFIFERKIYIIIYTHTIRIDPIATIKSLYSFTLIIILTYMILCTSFVVM